MSTPQLICIGRTSIDLFSDDIGKPFEEISGFRSFVGGTPLNIAVGAQRLGMSTAMLTGTSDDGVGRLVRRFLRDEGVSTDYMTIKHGSTTNAFMLAIQPPDTFEPVAYQSTSADLHLSVADVLAAPIPSAQALLYCGISLTGTTSHAASLAAAEVARAHNVTTYMDIDYKGHQWAEPREFGVFARGLLQLTDVAIGTEAEVRAAAGTDDIDAAAQRVLGLVAEAVVVKRGERGAVVYTRDGETYNAPVYPTEVLNVFGAGDAFAAGLIAARASGADWPTALRQAAACGALIVARHGCANDMPTADEVEAFLGGK